MKETSLDKWITGSLNLDSRKHAVILFLYVTACFQYSYSLSPESLLGDHRRLIVCPPNIAKCGGGQQSGVTELNLKSWCVLILWEQPAW